MIQCCHCSIHCCDLLLLYNYLELSASILYYMCIDTLLLFVLNKYFLPHLLDRVVLATNAGGMSYHSRALGGKHKRSLPSSGCRAVQRVAGGSQVVIDRPSTNQLPRTRPSHSGHAPGLPPNLGIPVVISSSVIRAPAGCCFKLSIRVYRHSSAATGCGFRL